MSGPHGREGGGAGQPRAPADRHPQAPVSGTRPAASIPATAQISSLSEVSPEIPTAPSSRPSRERISTPPGDRHERGRAGDVAHRGDEIGLRLGPGMDRPGAEAQSQGAVGLAAGDLGPAQRCAVLDGDGFERARASYTTTAIGFNPRVRASRRAVSTMLRAASSVRSIIGFHSLSPLQGGTLTFRGSGWGRSTMRAAPGFERTAVADLGRRVKRPGPGGDRRSSGWGRRQAAGLRGRKVVTRRVTRSGLDVMHRSLICCRRFAFNDDVELRASI